jgi:hypothetical protein
MTGECAGWTAVVNRSDAVDEDVGNPGGLLPWVLEGALSWTVSGSKNTRSAA